MTKPKKTTAERIAKHPMNTPTDLAYFRRKGYSDREILAFWDRDLADGKKPVHHRPAPDVVGNMLPRRTRRQIEHELVRIARKHLGIETLATRNSDGADFHNVAVWQVKEALLAAFELGYRIL